MPRTGVVRQDSKKLEKHIGRWNGNVETETDCQTGQAIYSQIQNVTKAESPRCLATDKTGASTHPPGDLSLTSILLAMWFRPPDLSSLQINI